MKPYFFPTILTSLSILPILSCGDLEKEKKNKRKENEILKELVDTTASLKQTQGELIEARDQLKKSQEDREEIQKKLEHNKKERDTQEADLKSIASSLELAQRSLRTKDDEISKLRSEVITQKKLLTVLEERLGKNEAEKKALEDAIKKAKADLSLKDRELKLALQEKDQVSREMSLQKTELEKLVAKVERSDSENAELREKLKLATAGFDERSIELVDAMKKTLEFKEGIFQSPKIGTSPTAGDCYHMAEIKNLGKVQLAVVCSNGPVEILTRDVKKVDAQFLDLGISTVGLVLEIDGSPSLCPETTLSKFNGLVIDKGLMDFSALDVENVLLQGPQVESEFLTTVAMNGFVLPTPSLDLARKISEDAPSSTSRKAVVAYLESTQPTGVTGCFDKEFNFKPLEK